MIEDLIRNARVASNGRKYFGSQEKATIVSAWEQSGLAGPEFSRRYGLIVHMLYRWRQLAKRGARMSIQQEGAIHGRAEVEALRRENEELKKIVAEKELDIKILKKKLELDAQRRLLEKSA